MQKIEHLVVYRSFLVTLSFLEDIDVVFSVTTFTSVSHLSALPVSHQVKLSGSSEQLSQLRRRCEATDEQQLQLDQQLQLARGQLQETEREREEARRELERRRLQLDTVTAERDQLERARTGLNAQVRGRREGQGGISWTGPGRG